MTKKNDDNTRQETNKGKKCFVITPIGGERTDIRRHIDGIIDIAIKPALKGKYDVAVAHRESEIGSINDKIITDIYDSDLVIANLTELNPNVMFELAIRYSFGKPAIVIAEKATKLPFDIIDERTIFYVNDPQGAEELKNKIVDFERKIDFQKNNYGPVYGALNRASIVKAVEEGTDISENQAMAYIVNRLDAIERKMGSNSAMANGKLIAERALTRRPKNISRMEVEWSPKKENDFEFIISDVMNTVEKVAGMNNGIWLEDAEQGRIKIGFVEMLNHMISQELTMEITELLIVKYEVDEKEIKIRFWV